ncbi:S26 family signal peptidase [Asanoa sp. WMMD1127]|uniref:S26 family signal peptidase n=1 Tax=Asanoa sp. WMMD1127 TaxID=3016107 RepID=UPI002415CA84|nr:S26 family signal peptidase [Asanoa sp. WMMD1127]MDG4825005.1 S26 family signal peptidase [Asanoa sp. WMMD1127]
MMMMLLLGAGATMLLAGGLIVLRRRTMVVTVLGPSMAPTLLPGDRVVVRRVPMARIRQGDVVVLRVAGPCRPGDPEGDRHAPLLIKRVAAGPGEPVPAALPTWAQTSGLVEPATFVVLGDNPEASNDSRHFGAVPAAGILGVVVRRFGGGPLARPATADMRSSSGPANDLRQGQLTASRRRRLEERDHLVQPNH